MVQPTESEIKEFLRVYDRLEKFDATTRFVRGYGALPDSDYPNKDCITVVAWLRELSEKTRYEENDE